MLLSVLLCDAFSIENIERRMEGSSMKDGFQRIRKEAVITLSRYHHWTFMGEVTKPVIRCPDSTQAPPAYKPRELLLN
jgi:hypothetical protein